MDAVANADWDERPDCKERLASSVSFARASVSFRLAWIGRMLRSRFDARAHTLGMTGAQWRMLAEIHFREGAMQSDIASCLEISSATAGRMIDRLEANGWIERRSDAADRRANRLFPRDAAVAMLRRLNLLAADEETLALDGFSAEDKARFVGYLDRLIDNMMVAATSDVPPE